jgi:hypothetical protein
MSVDQQPDEVVRGEGWLLFAGVMLIAASIMKFFDALWAFRYTGPVQDNLQDSILGRDLSTYGWLWLSVSLVLFICGLGVFVGSQLARWLGIAAAVIAAVTSIWSMPYLPDLVSHLYRHRDRSDLRAGGLRSASTDQLTGHIPGKTAMRSSSATPSPFTEPRGGWDSLIRP